mmetsp:Transcript_121509/g.349215  ORF Transcript_121509/g.349215 Transcript_121509/m.349215 type:complete len:491 (+) Transcript_121509:139-1611(+)
MVLSEDGGDPFGDGTSPLEDHTADEFAPLHGRRGHAASEQASASISLAKVAVKAMMGLSLAAGGAAAVALWNQPTEQLEAFQPRQALDCSWIQADDCVNTDWAACKCREMSPDGPCTTCPNPTCKKGCCKPGCKHESEDEAQKAAGEEAPIDDFGADGSVGAGKDRDSGDRSVGAGDETTTTTSSWDDAEDGVAGTVSDGNPLSATEDDMAEDVDESSKTTKPPAVVDDGATPLKFNIKLGKPSLFCFAVMLPNSNEVELIKQQERMKAGVFACAAYKIFSNTSLAIGQAATEGVRAKTGEPISLACNFQTFYPQGGGTPYRLALSSGIFVHVWQWLLRHQYHEVADYTVKVDPDTVFIPPLLQKRLRTHAKDGAPGSPVFFNNCPMQGQEMHGPIEVVSRSGAQALAAGLEGCIDAGLATREPTNREDWFLLECMRRAGATEVPDADLLTEAACPPFPNPVSCDTGRVAFHPFKDAGSWFKCWDQATAR